MEFLRSIAYLRPRANTFQAVFRVRSVAAYAIHKYFQDRNYIYVHTPLLTTADCEGSDQMFKVTTFDFDNLPKKMVKLILVKIYLIKRHLLQVQDNYMGKHLLYHLVKFILLDQHLDAKTQTLKHMQMNFG